MDDMKLPENKICGDCVHFNRCEMLFQCKLDAKECDFYPIKFVQKD